MESKPGVVDQAAPQQDWNQREQRYMVWAIDNFKLRRTQPSKISAFR